MRLARCCGCRPSSPAFSTSSYARWCITASQRPSPKTEPMTLSTFADMWESVFKIALLALNYILVGVAFITHAKSQVTGFSLGGMAGFILGTIGGWLYFVPTGWYAFFMISSISGGLIGSSLRFGKRPKREKSKGKEEDLHGS